MYSRQACRLTSVIFVAFLMVVPAFPQGLEYVKANYTKYEYYIPMRDGVRLFTAVYVPKDRSNTYPILLLRTPYSIGPYGVDRYRENIGPSPMLAKEGYIIVYQDVRGRWMSEGDFEHMRPHRPVKNGAKDIDESTDTYDAIEWLVKNISGNNGRVGIWGISYPGFYAAAGMIDAHPALKAVSPQAPVSDWFSSDDWHHNGALLLAHAFGWFSGAGWPFSKPTTVFPGKPIDRPIDDAYEFYFRLGPVRNANEKYFHNEIRFWNEMMKRESRDDWWKARNIRAHLKNIKPAVMTVGGWFDAENLFGALEVYRAVEAQSPGAFNILVMGPWVHGGWSGGKGDSLGDVRFDAPTAEFYRENIEFPFFNYFLKDKGRQDLPEAYVFETGANQWRKFDAWPPKTTVTKSLYLNANGKLSFEPPDSDSKPEFDEYISDPKKPVPFIPGMASGMAQRYMDEDQRFAARRPDVLVYQTEVLDEDVTIAGPVVPSLHVSTTGTDSDWIVKLIDVYPDRFPDEKGSVNNTMGGYQQLVRGEVMRGKFRNSLEKPEPFTPGQPTKVEFTVSDVFHTFRPGHRIMVQIQSTWFPLININPQKFLNINEATEADFQKATERVYRSRSLPSSVRVGVLPRVPVP
ncbi:MAG TPA: CocE/NonD family hydrolase [Acidobacteriota bacterium]|nr:CocE/NonD family hydrolase [Acidobacteriota bacterium]